MIIMRLKIIIISVLISLIVGSVYYSNIHTQRTTMISEQTRFDHMLSEQKERHTTSKYYDQTIPNLPTLDFKNSSMVDLASLEGPQIPLIEPITLRLIEDAYAKEYWPTTKTTVYPHLSIGFSTAYPEKRTETYIEYDMSTLTQIGASAEDIEKATLSITQLMNMAQNDFMIRVVNVPSPIRFHELTWPNRPMLGTVERTMIMPISGQMQTVDVTDHLKQALIEQRPNFGLALLMLDDSKPGALYYSSNCVGSPTQYPKCEPYMKPAISIYLKTSLEEPIITSYEPTLTKLDPNLVEWEIQEEAFCRLVVTDEDENTSYSEWTNKSTSTYQPETYGTYKIQVECKRSLASEITVNSASVTIRYIEIQDISPKIEVVGNTYRIDDPYDLEVVWSVVREGGQPIKISGFEIDLEDVCLLIGEGTEINLYATLLRNDGVSSLSSEPLSVTCVASGIEESTDIIDNSPPTTPLPPVANKKHTDNDTSKEKQDGSILGTQVSEEARKISYNNKKLRPAICTYHVDKETFQCEDILTEVSLVDCYKRTADEAFCDIRILSPEIAVIKKTSFFCQIAGNVFKNACNEKLERQAMTIRSTVYVNEKVVTTKKHSQEKEIIIAGPIKELRSTLRLKVLVELYVPQTSSKSVFSDIVYLGYEFKPVQTINDLIDIQQKPYLFPFETNIGVTQWHGYTTFASPHTGIDFGATRQQIYALSDGKIHSVGYDTYLGECNSGGYYMNIKHHDGRHSVYLHLEDPQLSRYIFAVGNAVNKGQVIGISGNTGAYNCQPLGYHLHLEVRESKDQNTHTDPVKLIAYDWNSVHTINSDLYPGRLTGDNPHPTY